MRSRREKEILFNVERHKTNWWFCYNLSFAEAWPTVSKYAEGQKILVLKLEYVKPGKRIITTFDVEAAARFELEIDSLIEISEHERFFVINKSELSKFIGQPIPPWFHWMDCNRLPTLFEFKPIYERHFKDDLFEEHLTSLLAKEFGSTVTCVSAYDSELRVEYKNDELGRSLLDTQTSVMLQEFGLVKNVEIKEDVLESVFNRAISERGPFAIRKTDFVILDNGFKVQMRGDERGTLFTVKNGLIQVVENRKSSDHHGLFFEFDRIERNLIWILVGILILLVINYFYSNQ